MVYETAGFLVLLKLNGMRGFMKIFTRNPERMDWNFLNMVELTQNPTRKLVLGMYPQTSQFDDGIS